MTTGSMQVWSTLQTEEYAVRNLGLEYLWILWKFHLVLKEKDRNNNWNKTTLEWEWKHFCFIFFWIFANVCGTECCHGSPSSWNRMDYEKNGLWKKQASSEVVQPNWANWEKVVNKRCEHDPSGHSGRAPDVLCEGGRRSQKVKPLGIKVECPDSGRVDEAVKDSRDPALC